MTRKLKLVGLLLLCSFSVIAQPPAGPGRGTPQHKNTLLNQSFWQNKPGLDAVKAEVAKGHSPNEMNAASYDPVVMAINNDAPAETIIYLIEQGGIDVNRLTHDTRTYIFWAAGRGNLELMKYLIKKGAKVQLQDSHGSTPFLFAAGNGQKNTAIYELLIAQGIDPKKELNHDGANALLLAVGSDEELQLVKYFESKGLNLKDTDADGNTAFDYAARAGNIEVMKKLRAKGIRPTNNAMIMAAMGGRRGAVNGIDVFKFIESQGIKPAAVNKEGNNALHFVVRRPGQLELAKYFLEKGASINQVNSEGNTVLMNAAASNTDLEVFDLLLPAVKNINAANNAGATALALAVRGNSPEVVKYLIGKGATINTVDAKGNNLAYYLIESFNPRQADRFDGKLEILKQQGFDFRIPQKDGNTVYHLAIGKNNLDLLKKLSVFGADINAKNKDGLTALHKAAMVSKNDEILKFLLANGAAKDVKTEFDETAYDLASENEFLSKAKISIDFLK